MRRMTTDEIHEVDLTILEHIDTFCREHGIRYGLAYGTLLGAVRHKGFIPWDDDADVFMPRDDYNRFIREYKNSREFCVFSSECGNACLTYARVCEMRRTYFKQGMLWTTESPGVGVDVFPYDRVPEDADEFDRMVEMCAEGMNKIWNARAHARYIPEYWRISRGNSFVRNLKNACHVLLNAQTALFSRRQARRLCLDYVEYLQKLGHKDSCRCGMLAFPKYKKKEAVPREWVENFTALEFCGRRFSAPAHWHQMLSNYYGDYMVVPPLDQRDTHGQCQTMYWR